MKKIISLLLIATMSVSLAACGSKAQTDNNEPQTSESSSQQETEDNQSEENSKTKADIETVELTADNWKDYFEVQPYARIQTDDFGEILFLSVDYGLVLKDEYTKNWSISDDAAIEFIASEEYFAPIEYNVTTNDNADNKTFYTSKEFKIGTPYTEEECKQKEYHSIMEQGYYKEMGGELTTCRFGEYYEYGFRMDELVAGGYYSPDVVNGELVTTDSRLYENFEVKRIKGTLSFEK